MKATDIKAGLISATTAFGASLCCVLPLAVVILGLGSGAFMTTTMQFRPVLYPVGLSGLAFSFYLFFRKSRACKKKSCPMPGKRTNIILLILSATLMGTVTYIDFFVSAI